MENSIIHEIQRQFRQGGRDSEWKQFLDSVKITNIHGWSGQEVLFKFPIVAIVGENGIGKSTVLKAAACAYENAAGETFYPSQMFVRTVWDEGAYRDAVIEYQIDQGGRKRYLKWQKRRSWAFSPKSKNSAGKSERSVFFLDISGTLPLDATAGYAKIAKQATSEIGSDALSEDVVRDLSYVLGRKYTEARFTGTDADPLRQVGLVTRNGGDPGIEISQFHQGAGEHSLLNLFKLLNDIPNQSLLLIDELENSLHPQAQRRLVAHLLKVCRAKKVQIILTTHSSFVLDSLPPIARVMLVRLRNGLDVVYGVSSALALSEMDEVRHPDLRIYVEDQEAETMFWEILRKDDSYAKLYNRIETHPVGSASVVETLDRLGRAGRLGYPGMGVLDADRQSDDAEILCLPGTLAPEKEVFNALKQRGWKDLDARFGLGAGILYKHLDDALLLKDHHQWTTYVGTQLEKSKDSVWEVLVEEWRKHCLDSGEAAAFVNAVKARLDPQPLDENV